MQYCFCKQERFHVLSIQSCKAIKILLLCSSDIVDPSSNTNMWPANWALTATMLYLSTAEFAHSPMSTWTADPILWSTHTHYTCACSNCSLLCCLSFLKQCISNMGRNAIHSRSCCCNPGHVIRAWQHIIVDDCPGCSLCYSQSLANSAGGSDWTKPPYMREATNFNCLFRRWCVCVSISIRQSSLMLHGTPDPHIWRNLSVCL